MSGTRRSTKIARYVEAVRELAALRAQMVADPSRLSSARFTAFLEAAKRERDLAFEDLRGGDLGKANRILATTAPPPKAMELPLCD